MAAEAAVVPAAGLCAAGFEVAGLGAVVDDVWAKRDAEASADRSRAEEMRSK
jgi:hypothetical protein